MSFQLFNLSESLKKAINDLGYENPTEIQAEAIPYLLDSEDDFVGQAQTGTGKTGAFLLPLIERLNLKSKSVQALVLTPTRELAQQVHGELEKYCKYLPVRSTTVFGGVPYETQIRNLQKSFAQVVVGTPGRIIDLMKRNVLDLTNCTQFVIDEADEMLNMGFLEDVQDIMKALPSEKRIWMFSATMPPVISNMVEREFSNPKIIQVKKTTLSNASITQHYCVLNRKDFSRGLRAICESQKDCFGIVFCETRQETVRVTETLLNYGISALSLNGELSQAQRNHALKMFKEKKVNILVCTDVAARGIDVSHITHVFNMGLPRQWESYVHRIGRTGRAGRLGEAISFITPSESRSLRGIERLTGQKMTSYPLPKVKDLKKMKVTHELEKLDGIKEALEAKKEDFVLDESYSYFRDYLQDLSKEEILKILFSYHFKKDMRQIEEGLNITTIPLSSGGSTFSSNRRERSSGDRGGHYRGGSDRGGSYRGANDRGGSDRGGNYRGGTYRGGSERSASDRGGNYRGGADRSGSERSSNERSGNYRGGYSRSASPREATSN